MAVANYPIGIQSWCFRGSKTNDQVIARLKECGVRAIELCGVHVDFKNEESVASAIAAYKDGGIRILSTGVNNVTGDATVDRPLFEFLKASGAGYMSVSFPVGIDKNALRNIESLADEYDVLLGIHNHGGCHWLGSPEILGYIFSITGKRIGLWLDTAWALDAGANPVKMIEQFGDRLYGLHIKDFTFDTARKPTDVVIGTGNLNLDTVKKTLDSVGFNGCTVIEYEGDVENPVPALSECVVKLKQAFGA